MIGIGCLDLKNGMFFNNRRQSQDKLLRKDILQMTKNSKLWMTQYTREQFEREKNFFAITENYFDEAGDEEYCFYENIHPVQSRMSRIIVYRWDKVYPADYRMKIRPEQFRLESTLEFQGYSHEKITKEVYVRNEDTMD